MEPLERLDASAQELVAVAAAAVSDAWRHLVQVAGAEILDREGETATVARVFLSEGEPVCTLVAKRAVGFDPRDTRQIPKRGWAILNEQAALATLGPLGVSPRLLAAGRAAGLVLMEDLGRGPCLDGLLGQPNSRAVHLLSRFASKLAQLHGAVLADPSRFQRLRDALGPGGTREAYEDVPGQVASFIAGCRRCGVETTHALRELDAVAAAIVQPGPWLGLIHGDPGPGNALVTGDDLRLIDFEVGGLGHVLVERASFAFLFPQVEACCKLPGKVVSALEAVYDDTLHDVARVRPDLESVIVASAYAMLSRVGEDLELMTAPQPYVAPDALFARAAVRLERFVALTGQHGSLPGLTAVARDLRQALGATPALATFPALQA